MNFLKIKILVLTSLGASGKAILADLGAILASLDAILVDLGAILADLGAILADRGAILADLGAILADRGAILADRLTVRPPDRPTDSIYTNSRSTAHAAPYYMICII